MKRVLVLCPKTQVSEIEKW